MGKESNEPRGLVHLSASPRQMPPDWKPPAPAWSVSFPNQTTPVVMAYFGTQLKSSEHLQVQSPMRDFLDRADTPDNLEHAYFVDRAGCRNLISSAYWTDPTRYGRWKEASGFDAWWRDPARLVDPRGYFREVLIVPPNRFETI